MKYLIIRIHSLNPNKVDIINRGVNLKESEVLETRDALRAQFNIPKDYYVMTSIGRHVPRKRFDLVIKAIKKMKEANPAIKIKYFLIGDGSETKKLKELTQKLNLQEEVQFVGICDNTHKNRLYKLSDVFVMPVHTDNKHIEGFGIVFVEANFYKIPVIGTSTGGVVEAIKDGETGLLLEKNDVDELADKLFYLYNNPDIRKRMGETGYKRVVNEFAWEKIANDYLATFKKLYNS